MKHFGKIHYSLRVTPAMAAGISDHVWKFAQTGGGVKYHGRETGKLSDDHAMRRVAECVLAAFVPCIARPPTVINQKSAGLPDNYRFEDPARSPIETRIANRLRLGAHWPPMLRVFFEE